MEPGEYVLFPLNNDPMSRARGRARIVSVDGDQVTVTYEEEARVVPLDDCVSVA